MSLNLETRLGGLVLPSPVIVGACPLTAKENVRLAIESAGAGAIVLPSLFEEQVALWNQRNRREPVVGERPLRERAAKHDFDLQWHDAETYLSFVNRASVQSTIPVIASLNGSRSEVWVDFARELEDTGAHAIELNLTIADFDGYESAAAIEDEICQSVAAIDSVVDIPVFAKLPPLFTSVGHLARRIQSGVQGVVLFGPEPDMDLCLDDLHFQCRWGLTEKGSVVHSLRRLTQVHAMCPSIPMIANGGIGSTEDAIKALLSGADAVMVTSAIYREGPSVIRTILDGLVQFMNSHSVTGMRQLAAMRPVPGDWEKRRLGYIAALTTKVEAEPKSKDCGRVSGDRWGHVGTLGSA
ncbi:tRNA-dihydrouridine synthase [Crateriforma spongiae]|uniref:tRNA-dihydrouridine synthase n=1 Tax=Crateriforma spongiae TaxID=2724528 RepID=UPI001444FF93|nr:tRNA-dihydrouridine synthase [Crateriforma spongiae]